MLSGLLEYQIDGKETRTYQRGEALTVPAGTTHAVRDVGDGLATELATYVVETGKPLLTVVQSTGSWRSHPQRARSSTECWRSTPRTATGTPCFGPREASFLTSERKTGGLASTVA